eukprot:CAMPEP_0194076132 /NCGR_PEP_ID=MMETSP0149-20130528/2991_1 /TAXON_ID=122233 /ORGANISM="Chaetoceros debilis, Strain MM31A-1" /LENGTH=126 /DNA_ID=CAMNT_0038756793 /DNA_START=235 /DNA_END=616 /DNA_ORIENTATION=+
MSGEPVRLYVNGAILGYQRGLRTQNNSCSLIKIKGVDSKADTDFYLGKKIAYITKVSVNGGKNGTKYRVNWGKDAVPMDPMELLDADLPEIYPQRVSERRSELCSTHPGSNAGAVTKKRRNIILLV